MLSRSSIASYLQPPKYSRNGKKVRYTFKNNIMKQFRIRYINLKNDVKTCPSECFMLKKTHNAHSGQCGDRDIHFRSFWTSFLDSPYHNWSKSTAFLKKTFHKKILKAVMNYSLQWNCKFRCGKKGIPQWKQIPTLGQQLSSTTKEVLLHTCTLGSPTLSSYTLNFLLYTLHDEGSS